MSKNRKGGLDQCGAERFGRLIFATIRKSMGLKRTEISGSKSVSGECADRGFLQLVT